MGGWRSGRRRAYGDRGRGACAAGERLGSGGVGPARGDGVLLVVGEAEPPRDDLVGDVVERRGPGVGVRPEHRERVAGRDAELGGDHAGRLVDLRAGRPVQRVQVAQQGEPDGVGEELHVLRPPRQRPGGGDEAQHADDPPSRVHRHGVVRARARDRLDRVGEDGEVVLVAAVVGPADDDVVLREGALDRALADHLAQPLDPGREAVGRGYGEPVVRRRRDRQRRAPGSEDGRGRLAQPRGEGQAAVGPGEGAREQLQQIRRGAHGVPPYLVHGQSDSAPRARSSAVRGRPRGAPGPGSSRTGCRKPPPG